MKETQCAGLEGMKKSTEYDRFKFFWWNRDIPKKNLEKVEQSMLAEGCSSNCYPIAVIKRGSEYYIADGQTRFTAAKELGYTIYYNIDNNVTDPFDDNEIFLKYTGRNDSQCGWTGPVFLETKIKIGNESAIWMGKILKKYSWLKFSPFETLIDTEGKTFVKGDVGNGSNTVEKRLKSHVSEFVIEDDTKILVEETLEWVNKVVHGCKTPKRELLAAVTFFRNTVNGKVRINRLNMIILKNIDTIGRYNHISDITEFLAQEYFLNNKKEDGSISWKFKGKKKVAAIITINNKNGGVVNIYNS